jgi:hypothetical protein
MGRPTDDPTLSTADRRRFLTVLGALGVTGLAGCGGDGDDTDTQTDTDAGGNGDDTDTQTDTDAGGNGNGDTTPTETGGNGGSTTEPPGSTTEPPETTTEPPEETPTDTPEQPLGENPSELLEIEGASLQAGETTTLSGTLENPYLFPVQNVEVTMTAPNDDWSVEATGDTQFDTIASQGTQDVGWEVTAPDDADGEFTVEGSVTYETTTDSADLAPTVSVVIFSPGDAPQEGLEAYYPLDGDTAVNQLTGTEAEVVGDASGGASGILGDAWEFTSDGNTETVASTVISEPLPINGETATIAAWFNAEEVTDDFSRVYHVDEAGNPGSTDSDNGPTNGYNIEFGGSSPTLSPQYWDGGSTGADSTTEVGVEFGSWFFLVTVMQGSECTFYVFDENGEVDGSPGSGNGTRPQSEEASLMMMCGDGRDTPGRMDEVRAYSRALSADEVEALYLASGGSSV